MVSPYLKHNKIMHGLIAQSKTSICVNIMLQIGSLSSANEEFKILNTINILLHFTYITSNLINNFSLNLNFLYTNKHIARWKLKKNKYFKWRKFTCKSEVEDIFHAQIEWINLLRIVCMEWSYARKVNFERSGSRLPVYWYLAKHHIEGI